MVMMNESESKLDDNREKLNYLLDCECSVVITDKGTFLYGTEHDLVLAIANALVSGALKNDDDPFSEIMMKAHILAVNYLMDKRGK